MNSTEQDYRDQESGGDYPYYLDMGGDLSRTEWEAAGCPVRP